MAAAREFSRFLQQERTWLQQLHIVTGSATVRVDRVYSRPIM
jgi:hypothetical protein